MLNLFTYFATGTNLNRRLEKPEQGLIFALSSRHGRDLQLLEDPGCGVKLLVVVPCDALIVGHLAPA